MKITNEFQVGDLVHHDIFGWRGFVSEIQEIAAGRGKIVHVFWGLPTPCPKSSCPYTSREQLSSIKILARW